MEYLFKIAVCVVVAIMALAAVFLVLHYAGIITAASPSMLWGFVWGPPAIVLAGVVVGFLVALETFD